MTRPGQETTAAAPMTPLEVADDLNVGVDVVLRLCRLGKLSAHKIEKVWRIYPADLAAYIASTRNDERASA